MEPLRSPGQVEHRSWLRWSVRVAAALALAAAPAYLPERIAGGGGSDQLDRLDREIERTRQAIALLRIGNAAQLREIAALKNDRAAIEDTARRALGMVKPGELVLRFDAEAGAAVARGRHP